MADSAVFSLVGKDKASTSQQDLTNISTECDKPETEQEPIKADGEADIKEPAGNIVEEKAEEVKAVKANVREDVDTVKPLRREKTMVESKTSAPARPQFSRGLSHGGGQRKFGLTSVKAKASKPKLEIDTNFKVASDSKTADRAKLHERDFSRDRKNNDTKESTSTGK